MSDGLKTGKVRSPILSMLPARLVSSPERDSGGCSVPWAW